MDRNNALMPTGPDQKAMSALNVAALWAGINICLPSFMLGAVLIPALSIKQAIFVTITGNAALCLLIHLTGLPGIDLGCSSALLACSVFGFPWGTLVPSLGVTVSMAGWSAILLDITGQALNEILLPAGINGKNPVIAFTGPAAVAAALAGVGGMRLVSNLSAPALFLLCIWIGHVLAAGYSWPALLAYPPDGSFSPSQAFDMVVGGTIAGAFVSSDLSRFARSRAAWGLGVTTGTLPVTVILALLGMAAQLATGSWNPVRMVNSLGMGIPSLFLLIFSTWTTSQVSLYSGGLALANLFPRLDRRAGTLLLGLLATALALANITEHFEGWLLLLNYLFTTLVGVLVAGILFPAPRTNTPAINWPALAAVAAGSLTRTAGTPLPNTVISLAVAAGVYLLLQRSPFFQR